MEKVKIKEINGIRFQGQVYVKLDDILMTLMKVQIAHPSIQIRAVLDCLENLEERMVVK